MSTTVADKTYYNILNVSPDASNLDLKKAYRRLALINHPDKNLGDEEAEHKFLEIGHAYQVLSDPKLRQRYDEFGLEAAKPDSGYEDPSELFGRIFGGDSFKSWIGELSYLKNAVKMMEMVKDDTESDRNTPDDHDGARKFLLGVERDEAGPGHDNLQYEQPEKAKTSSSSRQAKKLRDFKKQKEEDHQKRVFESSQAIIKRIENIIADPEDERARLRLTTRIQAEAELMKLESFGDQLLHTIGEGLSSRGKAYLESIPIISSVVGYFKDRITEFQDTLNVVASGVEAKKAVDALKKAEEEYSEYALPEQKKDQETKLVVGKVLAACWQTTIKEVRDIVREISDDILYDVTVTEACQRERAKALVLIGGIFGETARKSDDEVSEQMFEILVAEASKKPDR